MSDRPDRPEETHQEAADPAEGAPVRGLQPGFDAGQGPGGPAGGLAALDDLDIPLYTIGQAAELLGVPVAALRRLDEAGAISPGRSTGRHRRYSRRQLHLAQRVLTLVAEGTAITAARRIADLEGEVRDLREQLDEAAGTRPSPEH